MDKNRDISILSLYKIDALPVNYQHEIFDHYPAMKLGVDDSVSYYAEKLSRLAHSLIEVDRHDWVICAPAYHTLPAAANLLAWRVYDNLKVYNHINSVNLKLPKSLLKINTAEEFNRYYNYSNNDIKERIKERQRLSGVEDGIHEAKTKLRGRNILVINDIKVTGTQQIYMQKSFDAISVASVHWLYVIEVSEDIGKRNPQIEYAINHNKYSSIEEFKELISTKSVNYTARCLSRLFSHSMHDYINILEALDMEKKLTILHLAREDGRYGGDYFRVKLDLLESHCTDYILE